ncbi:hypothetical protein PHLGIDRAFT_28067 [Phlebiopsis gigantea 11061_1 CR5-6]|uniref:Bromo domain-containing protein n=1 Tax=Phlebiopsis gigantea (strain 11061_1 CR5-6) TaxID=745531 RepID=A0A0C3S595_PHLG1|nr:hypothetical protein PHLGIDRAFT_28067 [Phlebiopsis gigantea 11061_1 CR5-6]
MFAAQGVDVDAPRAKRQKTGAATAATATANGDAATANGTESISGENSRLVEDPEQVKERGLKLWQTIKDAKDKEGRQMSADFLRLPSKRLYPDYYEQIKRPVALDDIKRRLEGGGYAFFDEVKGDFELCFKNAKKYNMKESLIWQDAKHLHKLVTKEASKLTGISAAEDEDGEVNAEVDSDAEGAKKKKAPNMSRLLKTRLQKLVAKSDDDGRVLSTEFMELPNKKQWPIYYKLIKKPQCFENVFKRLKRKEYHSTTEFAGDIELVFSNALEFNQEHTQIWEDAVVLRDYFRQLMSDLPAPFSVPAYTVPDQSTKVKLKIPTIAQASTTSQAAALAAPVSPVVFTSVLSPPAPKAMPPIVNGSSFTSPAPMAPITPAVGAPGIPSLPQPAYPPGYSQHYPSYRAPGAATSLPNSNSINPARPYDSARPYTQQAPAPQASSLVSQRSHSQVPAAAKSPTPPETGRPLRHVAVATQPAGRRLDLSYRDGVKTWAARLSAGETSVRISEVRFSEDAEEHSDGEEREQPEAERHEEEEEEEEEQEQALPVKRGRGRPKKNRGKDSPKGKGKARAKGQVEDGVQVKLNSVVLTPTEVGVWDVELPPGLNIVEIGAKGGVTWRAYLDRIMAV